MKKINAASPEERPGGPKTIDEYLIQVPETPRATLEKVRQVIRAAAPMATEVMSYQIPTFRYIYSLVAFAAFKEHCGLYIMSKDLMKKLKKDLASYDASGVTIRFPHNKPLPAALIKKIVKERIKEVEIRKAKVTRK